MTEQVKENSLELKVDETVKSMKGKLDTMPLAQPHRVTMPMLGQELTPLMDEFYDTMLASGNLRTNFKGFRKGKVPKDMIIQHNGGFIRFYEPLFIELLRRWMGRHDKEICSYYDMLLDGDETTGFRLGATIYFMPRIELPKSLAFLKAQEVRDVDTDLVEQRVETHIEQERFKSATFEPLEAPISTGHQVTVRIDTTCGKKKVNARSGVLTSIIQGSASGVWWQDFVIGLIRGDRREQTFVDTEPHSKFFDKSLTATIEVQSVQKVILPPINAKFLERQGVRSENGWRQQLFTRFYDVMKQTVDTDMTTSAIDAILKKSRIDPIPSIWIESIVRQTMKNMKDRLGKANLLKLYNATTQVQLERNMQASTFIQLRDEMVLHAFAERNRMDTKADGWAQLAKSELADYIRALNEKKAKEPKPSDRPEK